MIFRERDAKPRFAELNTIEHTVGLKWKELELQEKQLLEEVKKRMQYATDQVQVEIDQMYLEHQSQVLREGRIIDQFFEQHMSRTVGCETYVYYFDGRFNCQIGIQ